MDDAKQLAARLERLEARHRKLFSMVLELTGASIEMATSMRKSSNTDVQAHGEEAWESVGRAMAVLGELKELESDGR